MNFQYSKDPVWRPPPHPAANCHEEEVEEEDESIPNKIQICCALVILIILSLSLSFLSWTPGNSLTSTSMRQQSLPPTQIKSSAPGMLMVRVMMLNQQQQSMQQAQMKPSVQEQPILMTPAVIPNEADRQIDDIQQEQQLDQQQQQLQEQQQLLQQQQQYQQQQINAVVWSEWSQWSSCVDKNGFCDPGRIHSRIRKCVSQFTGDPVPARLCKQRFNYDRDLEVAQCSRTCLRPSQAPLARRSSPQNYVLPQLETQSISCSNCTGDEICLLLMDQKVPFCARIKDINDQSGCGGWCKASNQLCQAMGNNGFKCIHDSECLPDEWRCHDSACVPLSKRCDGHSNCYDSSDERDCPPQNHISDFNSGLSSSSTTMTTITVIPVEIRRRRRRQSTRNQM